MGTIGLWALSESWRTGARLAAVIEVVARLAAVIEATHLGTVARLVAVIDCARKAEIGPGKLELGVDSWNWAWTVGIGRGKLELGVDSWNWAWNYFL